MISTRTFKRLPRRLQGVFEPPGPEAVEVCLTRRCNERCRHCLVIKRRDCALDFRAVLRIIRESADLGSSQMQFTGGEVFLYPRWFEVFSSARKAGLAVRIITNGTLVTSGIARRLAAVSPLDVQVSVYGADAATHEYITRVPGSFQRTMRSLELLQRQGVRATVAVMVMRHNAHQAFMLKSALERRGIPVNLDYTLRPRDSGSKLPLRLRVTGSQLRQAYLAGLLPFFRERSLLRLKPAELQYRSLGRNYLFIDANGDVYPAVTCRLKAGSIHRHSLGRIWRSSPVLVRLRSLRLEDFSCSRCASVLNCLWDPGLALIEHGSLSVRPREYCRFMNSRLNKEERDEKTAGVTQKPQHRHPRH